MGSITGLIVLILMSVFFAGVGTLWDTWEVGYASGVIAGMLIPHINRIGGKDSG